MPISGLWIHGPFVGDRTAFPEGLVTNRRSGTYKKRTDIDRRDITFFWSVSWVCWKERKRSKKEVKQTQRLGYWILWSWKRFLRIWRLPVKKWKLSCQILLKRQLLDRIPEASFVILFPKPRNSIHFLCVSAGSMKRKENRRKAETLVKSSCPAINSSTFVSFPLWYCCWAVAGAYNVTQWNRDWILTERLYYWFSSVTYLSLRIQFSMKHAGKEQRERILCQQHLRFRFQVFKKMNPGIAG